MQQRAPLTLGGLPQGRVAVLRWLAPVVPQCAGRVGMSPLLAVVDTAVLFTAVELITAVVPTMVLVPWLLASQSVPPLVRRRHPRTTLQRHIIIPTTRIKDQDVIEAHSAWIPDFIALDLGLDGAKGCIAGVQARYCTILQSRVTGGWAYKKLHETTCPRAFAALQRSSIPGLAA